MCITFRLSSHAFPKQNGVERVCTVFTSLDIKMYLQMTSNIQKDECRSDVNTAPASEMRPSPDGGLVNNAKGCRQEFSNRGLSKPFSVSHLIPQHTSNHVPFRQLVYNGGSRREGEMGHPC